MTTTILTSDQKRLLKRFVVTAVADTHRFADQHIGDPAAKKIRQEASEVAELIEGLEDWVRQPEVPRHSVR